MLAVQDDVHDVALLAAPHADSAILAFSFSLPNVFVSRSALVSHSIYLRDGLHCFISEVASKNTRKKTSGSAAEELLIYTSALLDVLMETTSVQTRKEKLRKGRTQKAFLHSKRKVGEIVFLFGPRLCARVSEKRFFLLPRRLHKRRRSMMEMCSIKSRPYLASPSPRELRLQDCKRSGLLSLIMSLIGVPIIKCAAFNGKVSVSAGLRSLSSPRGCSNYQPLPPPSENKKSFSGSRNSFQRKRDFLP